MRFVEATGAAWTAEQLRAAEAELEAQKREWEANRLAAMQKEEQLLKQETEAEELLTYSRKDASNQVNTKQDSNLSKRTPGAGAGVGAGFELGIRLTKHNKRDKRFKHHGVFRGAGINRSLSNKQVATTVQQVSSVRTRRNSLLNVSAPARSSGNNSNNSTNRKKSIDVPARRQTRLHSLGGATATPPTRKTTRTATAAAVSATDTSLASEERPKRQSANIAMIKLMKTPVKGTASTAARNSSAAKVRRRGSVSLTSTSVGQKKLFERRATISAPMALKQMKRNKSSASGDEDDDKDDNDEGEEDEDEVESLSVEVDEAEADEETVVSARASTSPSAQGDTTQTEDEEEMHVERLNDEVDEDDESNDDGDDNEEDNHGEESENAQADSDDDVDIETQSSSSYATAGEGAKSLDGWSAHDQVQDTTMTTSTYYNVSEESDTDDPNDPLSLANAETKSEIKESTPALQRKRTSSSRSRGGGGGGSDDAILGHTPRTRSRGSVKINLWKLDVSPVPSSQKPGSAIKVARRSTPRSEVSQTEPKRTVGRKSLLKKATEEGNQSTKLTRWITKTPRGRQRSTGNTASTKSVATSTDNSSNGAGGNR